MNIVRSLTYTAFVVCFTMVINVFGQGGNSISGHIFGNQRLPLEGITVELLDDFSRTLSRVRTNSTGRYFFNRMPAGRYRIRVLSLGTNYEEQEQEVEIQNMTRTDSRGQRVTTAFANAQADFYLRIAKEGPPSVTDTIFAQDVPEPAKRLYDEAIYLLNDKKSREGSEKLKAAIEVFPEYYLAIERLGLEYINAKHYQAAQILLQRAAEINSKSYKAFYGLAYALYSLKLDSDALKAIKGALEINPSSPDALLLAGTLLRQTNNYEEAEKCLVKIKKVAKKPIPEVHWQLALLYGNNLNRYKDAAEELELFIKYVTENKDIEKIKSLIKTFREKSKQT